MELFRNVIQFLGSSAFQIQSKHNPEIVTAMYTQFLNVKDHSIYDSIVCDLLSLACGEFRHASLCFNPVFLLKYNTLNIDFENIDTFLKSFTQESGSIM